MQFLLVLKKQLFDFKLGKGWKQDFLTVLFNLNIVAVILLVFFSGFLVAITSNQNLEAAFFILLVTFLMAISGIFVSTSIFSKNIFKDPEGLIIVLIFAFLGTVSTLFVDEPNSANTFGSIFLKSFSGLAIVSFVLIFYFINTTFNFKDRKDLILKALLAGQALLPFALIFANKEEMQHTIIPTQLTLFVFFIFYIYFLTKDTYSKTLSIMGIAGSIGVFIQLLNDSSETVQDLRLDSYNWFVLGLVVLVSSIISKILVLYYLKKYDWKNFRTGFINFVKGKNINRFLENYRGVVFLDILIIFSILVLVYLFASKSLDSDYVKNIYDTRIDKYDSIWSDLKDEGAKNVIFGLGALDLLRTSSFFENLLSSLGLAGIASYLIVICYAVKKKLAFFKSSAKKKELLKSDVFFVTFILQTLVFLSLFYYPGITLIYIFWLMFSILALFTTKDNKNDFSKDIKLKKEKTLVINGIRIDGFLLKIAGVIIVTIITLVSIWQVFEVSGEKIFA